MASSSLDPQMMLQYLENRVAFTRLLFPAEAKLAMAIADPDSATADPASMGSSAVGTEGLLSRMQLLQKSVGTGRRLFPRCSEVLDKFLEGDMCHLLFLEKGTPEEQEKNKALFLQLKDDMQKAFWKDRLPSEC